MGVDYSYNCISAKIVEKLGTFAHEDGDKEVLLCDLQFEDEHGRRLEPLEGALVVRDEYGADLEDCPENFLPADASEHDYAHFEELCAGNPDYHAYDPHELARLLGD